METRKYSYTYELGNQTISKFGYERQQERDNQQRSEACLTSVTETESQYISE